MGIRKKIVIIVGARPQFIKHAAIEIATREFFDIVTIHTGQHYDKNMSDIFFNELNIKPPTYTLSIGSSNHGKQTGQMMIEIEAIIENEKPDMVLVYGDTNSTLAGALVASKLHIPVAHVESGLRSYNNKMPEEINRVLTDHVSGLLFCPTSTAFKNLESEGFKKNIYNVGDVMYDMIRISKEKGIVKIDNTTGFYFATIHRPYNTDTQERLSEILAALNSLDLKVIFSLHPRTKSKMAGWSLLESSFENIKFIDPASYFECLNYQYNSKAVITDSGGIQKEAYILKKKCITIRTETEWIETLTSGWNTLVFDDLTNLKGILNKEPGSYINDIYGNGNAAEKMVNLIVDYLSEIKLN